MKIEKILNINKCNYEIKKMGNVMIYIVNNKKMVVVISNDTNVFSISRKVFNRIDDELLPYCFLLVNSKIKQIYFVEVKEPQNFLRKSFESTKKDTLFFGKQVLNNKIGENEILNKIQKI